MVTAIVARSSSRVTDAKPVMDLIISYLARGPTRAPDALAPQRSRVCARSSRRRCARACPAQNVAVWRPFAGSSRDALGRHHSPFGLAPFEELHLGQRRVDAAGAREQLVVPADFDDAAALEND